MRRPLASRYLLLLAFSTASVPFAAQAESTHGKELHNANCIQCHSNMFGGDGSGIYTRPNRRVRSLQGLEKQVRFCAQNLGHTWFDDEIQEVSNYLNREFYHFEE